MNITKVAKLTQNILQTTPRNQVTIWDVDYTHLNWMLNEIIAGYVQHDKAHRWLGFIQGAMTAQGVTTVEQLKQVNKNSMAHKMSKTLKAATDVEENCHEGKAPCYAAIYFREAADELDRLTEINTELVKALEAVCSDIDMYGQDCYDQVYAAIAKAKEQAND